MSLDRAIASGNERRKPYRGSKRYDRTCRNHGACDYCRGNRMHKHRLRELAAQESESDWLDESIEAANGRDA